MFLSANPSHPVHRARHARRVRREESQTVVEPAATLEPALSGWGDVGTFITNLSSQKTAADIAKAQAATAAAQARTAEASKASTGGASISPWMFAGAGVSLLLFFLNRKRGR